MSLLRSHLLLYFTQKHCSREDERSLCATATKPKTNCVRTGGDYFRVQGGHGKGALAAGGSCLHPETTYFYPALLPSRFSASSSPACGSGCRRWGRERGRCLQSN